MSVLNPALERELRKALETVTTPVTLVVFKNSDADAVACEICDDTQQLAEEIAWVSDGKVVAEVHDAAHESDLARAYGVDKVPAVIVLGGADARKDYGIRFFGIPSGYEFGTLIEDIRMVSRGGADLALATRDVLTALRAPVHLQVFVTPTCPYCPRAVLLAHKLALASELITSDMVNASEFPELADEYDVHGVPRTVINGVLHVEGAVPEAMLVEQLATLMTADEGRAKAGIAPALE